MQGRIITHRVVAKDVGSDGRVYLTTRGDANSAADIYFVDSENLIGRLKWCSEDEGFFVTFLAFVSSGFGFFSCIALPAIVIAILILKRCICTMMTEIRNLRSAMSSYADESECEDKEESNNVGGVSLDMTTEEYEQMYQRIRADLEEELRQNNDRGQQKKE